MVRPGPSVLTVSIRDSRQRESVSLTVYAGMDSAFEVARLVQDHLRRRYSTTDVYDRRHKRR